MLTISSFFNGGIQPVDTPKTHENRLYEKSITINVAEPPNLPNPIFPIAEDKEVKATTTEPIDPILCSCISGLRSFGVLLPPKPVNAEDLEGNTTPSNGIVILFEYPNEVYHAALIKFILLGGVYIQETNYESCAFTERFVPFDDQYIRGFYQLDQ